MKTLLITICTILSISFSAQKYDDLQKMDGVTQNVYFSKNRKDRAVKITKNLISADEYFSKELNVHPDYTLFILNPTDWKKYAHPNAIYGIPHFLPDGRLVMASDDNEFWKRNTPNLNQVPKLAKKFRKTYQTQNGEISLQPFFDLLAIHEMGHAFQQKAGMVKQRHWLNELMCNLLLHAYVAEKNPALLSDLVMFPDATIAATDRKKLAFTKLDDFEKHYNEIAQKHPDNYGWYQCRFHNAAKNIYNRGGLNAIKILWNDLLIPKEQLNDQQLSELLSTARNPEIGNLIKNWDGNGR